MDHPTGSQADIAARLRRHLPRSWFGEGDRPTPVLDSLLWGLAAILCGSFDLYAFAKAQTRLATATGGWLDLAALDYFGPDAFPRFRGEGDRAYSRRLRQEVLRRRVTRGAIDSVVFDLTGSHPRIFEGWDSPTTGGWGTPAFAFGAAGLWGSSSAPLHTIVSMPLPQGYGIPNRGGWGSRVGGYGVGNFSFANDVDLIGSGPTQADIIAAIDRVRAAGTTIIVQFDSPLGFDPDDPGTQEPGNPNSRDGLLDFDTEEGAGLIPFLQ